LNSSIRNCEENKRRESSFDIRKILYERTSMVVLGREFAFYQIIIDEIYLPDEHRWKED